MKKTAAVIITAVLVLTLGSTTVFAVGSGRAQNSQTAPSAGNSAKHCPNYNLTCTGTIHRHARNNRNSSGFPGHHGSSCEYETEQFLWIN